VGAVTKRCFDRRRPGRAHRLCRPPGAPNITATPALGSRAASHDPTRRQRASPRGASRPLDQRRPRAERGGREAARPAAAPQRERLMSRRTRLALAWGVHLYTALGLVCAAGVAVRLVEGGDEAFRAAFWLMGLATLIDATDGTLARAIRI